MDYSKDQVGSMVIEVATSYADGFKRNISQLNTAGENEMAERCSMAASNTGYFILKAFGFTENEIGDLRQSLDRAFGREGEGMK